METPIGSLLHVWEGKGSKYRETPGPSDQMATIRAYAKVRDDIPLVKKSTRTVRRWGARAGESRLAATGAVGWSYLGPHDLRRTCGTLLVKVEVEAGLVMEWSGWEDWETFREHYLGAYSLDTQQKGMEMVVWL